MRVLKLNDSLNLPGIDWDNGVVNARAKNKSQCELLLSSLDTHALAQIHKKPGREEYILDLDLDHKLPGLIKWGQFVIPTGLYSDRSIFRQVVIPTGRYSDRSIFRQVVIPTGRYSDRFIF